MKVLSKLVKLFQRLDGTVSFFKINSSWAPPRVKSSLKSSLNYSLLYISPAIPEISAGTKRQTDKNYKKIYFSTCTVCTNKHSNFIYFICKNFNYKCHVKVFICIKGKSSYWHNYLCFKLNHQPIDQAVSVSNH